MGSRLTTLSTSSVNIPDIIPKLSHYRVRIQFIWLERPASAVTALYRRNRSELTINFGTFVYHNRRLRGYSRVSRDQGMRKTTLLTTLSSRALNARCMRPPPVSRPCPLPLSWACIDPEVWLQYACTRVDKDGNRWHMVHGGTRCQGISQKVYLAREKFVFWKRCSCQEIFAQ